MDSDLIPRYLIAKKLNITYLKKLENIILEYGIIPVKTNSHGIQYYYKQDLAFLKNKQTELYNHFMENFLTYDECKKLGMSSYDISTIASKKLPELIRIDKFYNKGIVYDKASAQQLVAKLEKRRNFLNITQISKLLGVRYLFTNTILEEWGITAKDKGLSKYYDPKDVDYLLQKQAERYKYFTENYYTAKEIELLGVTYHRDHFKEIRGVNIDSIAKIDKLKGLRVVYRKCVVDRFLEKQRLGETIEQLDKEGKLKGRVNEQNKQLEKERQRTEKGEQKQSKGIDRSLSDRIANNLQIDLTNEELIEILNEHNISYYHISKDQIDIYDEKKIDMLLQIQSAQYQYYTQKYFTSAETIGLGVSLNSVNLKKVPVPKLIKIKKFKRNTVVFEKIHVLENVKTKMKSLLIDGIIEKYSDPYKTYQETIEALDIKFSVESTLTEQYWSAYVKNFLYTSKGSKVTVKKNIKRFVAITELLISITIKKEIFAFSARELNLLLFNEKVFQGYREILFSFINKVNESLSQKIINAELLNNPYAEKREKQKIKTNREIYSTKEFIDLLNYVSKTELHKKRSLKDIDNLVGDARKYKKYDSAWLYILLHMNNGWRSSDISSFPRVDLSYIGIKSLKEYKEKTLSVEEAKLLINQIRTKMPFTHSKNQQRRYFFCSDELEYPLANAILTCELRTREFNPENISIIDFKNARQELLKSTHDNFFADFTIKDFKFASLKMNRTFITFMTNIVKEKTGRNPLEISKYIRNHSDIDTTNIYVEIPKEHLDVLTQQLFDTGYFGYTFELLAAVLLGKSQSPEDRELQVIDIVKEVFGDVYKIENLSSYINQIRHEGMALGNYLNEQSADEVSRKLNLIQLGQLPSKEAYYQCLYGDCIFQERDCSKCPFSIPHFYVLSSLGEKLGKRISDYKKAINDGIEGEKIRAANQLFSKLLILKKAKDKFGKEVISEFINMDYNDLLFEIQSIDNPYEYITITIKD